MNENRTYGIEIECYAQISMSEMGARLREALQGLNHGVSVESYGHDVNQSNFRTWKVKMDGSLNNAPSGFPYAMEIVSPILKGQAGLDALKAVCDALNGVATVNSTCGLHVHHGVNTRNDSMETLARNFYMSEKFFYMVLPNSRQHNRYCVKWTERTSWMDSEVSRIGVTSWYTRHIGSRYSGLNLESLRMRSTVEFRMHSGSVEYEKIKFWVTFTQAFVDAGCAGTQLNPNDFENFVSFFETQPETPAEPEMMPVQNETPVFIHPQAKKRRLPKDNTKAGVLAKMLFEGQYSKYEIALKFVELYGRLPNKDMEESIGSRIAEFKSLKYGYGANIIEGRGGKLQWVALNQATVTRLVRRGALSFGEDVKQACAWMRTRYASFQGRRERREEERRAA